MLVEAAVTALILAALDRVGGRHAPPAAPPPRRDPSPPPGHLSPAAAPVLTEDQAARVTRPAGDGRVFAPEILPGLLRVLACRSAVPVTVAGLTGWQVCPLRGDLALASEVVRRAAARGEAVAASLTLVLTQGDSSFPAILLPVPEAAAGPLTTSGPFAILVAPERKGENELTPSETPPARETAESPPAAAASEPVEATVPAETAATPEVVTTPRRAKVKGGRRKTEVTKASSKPQYANGAAHLAAGGG